MKLNQKLISHYFLSTRSLYSASFHFHCFFFSLHVWALQGTAKYHFWKWLTLITIFWIEIKSFPPSPTSPIQSVFIMCNLEMMMIKSIIIVTALYHHSGPTQPLAHPINVYQGQLARKEVHCVGCTIPGANPSRRHLWLWGVGAMWNKSNVCLLVSLEQHGRNHSWPSSTGWWRPGF